MILEQWLESKSKPSNLALACFEYISSRDASKAVSIIDEHQMNSIAAKLLSSIKLHSDNLAEALDAVSLIENINFLVLNATYFHLILSRSRFQNHENLTFTPISASSGTKSSPSVLQSSV